MHRKLCLGRLWKFLENIRTNNCYHGLFGAAVAEFVLFIQNGIRLLDADGNLIQTAAELFFI